VEAAVVADQPSSASIPRGPQGDLAKVAPAVGPAQADRVAKGHPLGELFARLWAGKTDGATIELRLAGGEILVPDGFAAGLSRQNHGVFVVKDPDGTHTVTAVAWDAVERVLLRGVKQLPAELGG
jgi:hypothetical protein